MSGYMRAKAKQLITIGAEQYRQEDFFGHPPRSLSDQEMRNLLHGAQQIVAGRGFQEDRPITSVDLNHLILLVHCFHFTAGRIQSVFEGDRWKDEIPISHIISPIEAVLYSHSASATDRSRQTRREGIFQRIGPDYLPSLGYQPALVHSQVVETGTLGEYRFVLHTDCLAEGTIEYRHVMFFYALDESLPCLAISAEKSSYDPSLLMLCLFKGRKHSNLGSKHDIESVSDFMQVAIETASSMLST